MPNLIHTLRWRGMLQDIAAGTEAFLQQGPSKGYVGFDPSSSSLHLGNLVTIMLLKYLQASGHTPIALVGGATGMIGDPSGRTQERAFLTEEEVRNNQQAIGKQLMHFLDFSSCSNRAQLLNNLDWFKEKSLLDFLRQIGKHMPMGYMMAKESVKQRLTTGISYTEFAYQLLQGYDFYHLYVQQGVCLQMGGSDQWGNLTTGIELIRKKAQGQAFACTAPLLTRADGTKFGKTADGHNVWLDPQRTTPYAFYQFLFNTPDEQASRLIRIFHPGNQEEVEELLASHQEKPEKRILQQTLAALVTKMVHTEENYKSAILATSILFGHGNVAASLLALNEADLLAMCTSLPKVKIDKVAFEREATICALLSSATHGIIFTSKSEAKRMILSGGVRMNQTLVHDPLTKPTTQLLHHRYLLVQKGKKNHYLLIIE